MSPRLKYRSDSRPRLPMVILVGIVKVFRNMRRMLRYILANSHGALG